MPGKASDSTAMQYVGAAVFVVAVVGYVAFGWRFGDLENLTPVVIGALVAAVAVGYTVYRVMNT